MAKTPSTMIPLGTIAANFNLLDSRTGQMISLQDLKSDIATVIFFICNHCPYVKHIQHRLVEVSDQYIKRGVSFIAINSNDTKRYPEDGPAEMRLEAERLHYPFPYLFDESQAVAKAYQAACTPDFFLFDHNLACVYRGRFDESTPGNHLPVTGIDLTTALDNLLTGQPIDSDQKASVGCNIKWIES